MRALGIAFLATSSLMGISSASLADSDGHDVTSAMQHAYRMEERNDAARRQWQRDLQQWGLNAELNRERMLGAGYGSARLRPDVAAMFFRPPARYAYERLAKMAAAGAPGDPRGQKQILALYVALIDQFNADSGTAKYFVPSARMVFLQAAYRVFNGDRFSDPVARQLGLQAVIWVMMNSPEFRGESTFEKQALYERYIVLGGLLTLAYRWAGTSPDSMTRAQLRRLAAGELLKDMGRDPSTMSLDQLPCVAFPLPMISCQTQLKVMRGGSP
jgi:hypothetical protein